MGGLAEAPRSPWSFCRCQSTPCHVSYCCVRCSISYQTIRDTGAKELARMLARNTSLTDFRMADGKVAYKGILGIAQVLRRNLCRLKLLNVRGHRCTTEFSCLIGFALAGSSTLEALHFGPFHSIPVQRISGRGRTAPYALDLSALGWALQLMVCPPPNAFLPVPGYPPPPSAGPLVRCDYPPAY
jgi:hypothetical protein